MQNKEFIEINKKGWNELIKANKPFSNTILPEYGPFLTRNEDDMHLITNIKKAKILDMGCGAGKSLEYLYEKGAEDIWGIDISEEQIAKAKENMPQFKDNFIVSPMEAKADIPHNYFDYVVSIYSIGYTSDLFQTLKNAYDYLNSSGSMIISWIHPFYNCLSVDEDKVVVEKPYFDENSMEVVKGPDKVKMRQKKLMISTIINIAIKIGFILEDILEEGTILKDDINGYKSAFFFKEKTEKCPSTIIFKFKKIDNMEGGK